VAAEHTYTLLIALQVDDAASYARYRQHMTPLLHAQGGDFGVDLEVSRVYKAPEGGPLNRVFTIGFPSQAASDRFFADPAYLAIRAEHFEPAVSRVLTVASWGR
jgi:uncharacterized protein (DUF1330 family)